MKLIDVVSSIVTNDDLVSDKDIEETILYLLRDNILQDARALKRIYKKLKDDIEYKEALEE